MSTAARAPAVPLEQAVLAGLAPDGGLYMPAELAAFPRDTLASLRGSAPAAVGAALARTLFGVEGLEPAVADALSFEFPIVQLHERLFVLELFHGPTLSFKDVGARVLARLIGRFAADQPVTIVTATSGDTGGAVAHAFHGIAGTRALILYPRGQVSDRQERQFASLGGNVCAIAVDGTFDDCQRLAKGALADPDFLSGEAMTSANSINVGRLLPQVLYYVQAWLQLPEDAAPVVFSVPSGNFGNLTAGLIARKQGVPIDRFVAATNVNDAFTSYLETGQGVAKPSRRTLSSAMDVGNPSNLARIHHLYDGDVAALRKDVGTSTHTDDETRSAIRMVFDRFGYVMDPHTAVGFLALESAMTSHPELTGVVLATAHPAKFAEVVEPIIGQEVEVPARLASVLNREVKAAVIAPTLEALQQMVLG